MFLLSKLLPLLVQPLGVTLALLLWAGVRRCQWPVWTGLAWLTLFSMPLTAEGLWRWLEWGQQRCTAADTLARARAIDPTFQPQAIVVLGTGRHPAPGPARVSEWTDADRFFGGLEVFAALTTQPPPEQPPAEQTPPEQPPPEQTMAEPQPTLIFTGGWWPNQPALPPEGAVLRDQALQLGLPAAQLRTTPRVRNTAEEAKAVAAMVPSSSTVVLVTSAFHMPRAQHLFEGQGLRVLPFPVDFQASGTWAGQPLSDPLRWFPSASGLEGSSRALRELLGRTVYGAHRYGAHRPAGRSQDGDKPAVGAGCTP